MNSAEPSPGVATDDIAAPGSAGSEVDALRHLMIAATQKLLGDTISVTDDEWRGPSRLPGWTRGHVATHLARHAEAVVRLVEGARSGHPQPMYASPEQREADIEAGAGRSGLELQIDLDTTAGALAEEFEAVEREAAWDTVVEMRGGVRAPVRLLPLNRLCEVILHHVDLDIGLDIEQVDEPTADWLLEWLAFRLRTRADFPRIRVGSDSGTSVLIGPEGPETQPVEVCGTSARLLGWLTGRSTAENLTGAEGLVLPAF